MGDLVHYCTGHSASCNSASGRPQHRGGGGGGGGGGEGGEHDVKVLTTASFKMEYALLICTFAKVFDSVCFNISGLCKYRI